MALIIDFACPFDFQVKKKWELPKLEEEVETDLRIAQKKPWCQS